MPGENQDKLMSGNQPEVQYAAFLAIDWADQKHVWSLQCPFGKPVWVSLARRRLRPEAITLAPFFQPEDRAARFFLPCSARLIASMENFSGS